MQDMKQMVESLKANIAKVVVGKENVVELMLCAVLCQGHVLIEDVPGVGKTSLVSALARTISCPSKRIQFTDSIIHYNITYCIGIQTIVYQKQL